MRCQRRCSGERAYPDRVVQAGIMEVVGCILEAWRVLPSDLALAQAACLTKPENKG